MREGRSHRQNEMRHTKIKILVDPIPNLADRTNEKPRLDPLRWLPEDLRCPRYNRFLLSF